MKTNLICRFGHVIIQKHKPKSNYFTILITLTWLKLRATYFRQGHFNTNTLHSQKLVQIIWTNNIFTYLLKLTNTILFCIVFRYFQIFEISFCQFPTQVQCASVILCFKSLTIKDGCLLLFKIILP
jgi:hypothetical protein